MIKLGTAVTDRVTGLSGVATGRAEYLAGCVRVLIEYLGKDGDPKECWIDEARLEGPTKAAVSGGPASDPPKRDG